MSQKIDVCIIGGGMITKDLLLPSIYHLQRTGIAGDIRVCALNNAPLKDLAQDAEIREAYPGQSFTAYPALSEPSDKNFPDLYLEVLAGLPPRSAVVVALPDQMHYGAVMDALHHNQHVLCVKPLVLTYKEAEEIEHAAREKGLFVGVEYHKRFDRRSLLARRAVRAGQMGKFVMGEAKLIEPYYYRFSNFQNWFTTDKTDPFTYVGCHYVDLVTFITGLKPVEVSLAGVVGTFPNGKKGYMWANGRVRFENDALLSVSDGLGYPDAAAGYNDQCLSMFFEGDNKGGIIKHDDQFRGVTYCRVDGGSAPFKFINPDFYRLVPWEGDGFKPVGYGFESVAAIIGTIARIEQAAAGLSDKESLAKRRQMIAEVDAKGLIATPANSSMNELVTEAGRLSIGRNGVPVRIEYGKNPHVVE